MDIKKIEKWFDDYSLSFISNDLDVDRDMELKRKHSERVREIIRSLSVSLSLDERKTKLAEIAALSHDVEGISSIRCTGPSLIAFPWTMPN